MQKKRGMGKEKEKEQRKTKFKLLKVGGNLDISPGGGNINPDTKPFKKEETERRALEGGRLAKTTEIPKIRKS